MNTLRNKFDYLESQVDEQLIKALAEREYDFLKLSARLNYPKELELHKDIEKENYSSLLADSDIFDFLPVIRVDDISGNIVECYVISANSEGLYLYNNVGCFTIKYEINKISSLLGKINFIDHLIQCKKDSWIQTDGSLSSLQYGRKVNKFCWEYVELGGDYSYSEEVEKDRVASDFKYKSINKIDIREYDLESIESDLNSFGYKLENFDIPGEVFKISQAGHTYVGEEAVQLICECISEMIS